MRITIVVLVFTIFSCDNNTHGKNDKSISANENYSSSIDGYWLMKPTDDWIKNRIDYSNVATNSLIEIRRDSIYIHEFFMGPLWGTETVGIIKKSEDSISYLPVQEIKWSTNTGDLYHIKRNCWVPLKIFRIKEELIITREIKRFTYLRTGRSDVIRLNVVYESIESIPENKFPHYPIKIYLSRFSNKDKISERIEDCKIRNRKENDQ